MIMHMEVPYKHSVLDKCKVLWLYELSLVTAATKSENCFQPSAVNFFLVLNTSTFKNPYIPASQEEPYGGYRKLDSSKASSPGRPEVTI